MATNTFLRKKAIQNSEMKLNTIFSTLFVVILLALTACNEPTVIGSDLLADNEYDVIFTDTIGLKFSTAIDDSVYTYIPGNTRANFLIGNMDNPVFGTAKAAFFAQLQRPRLPDFSNATLDSIVLILPLDSIRSYGNTEYDQFDLEVFRMTEKIDETEGYYSTSSFETEALPLGSASVTPRFKDSVEVVISLNDQPDTVKYPAQLRIRLDDMFAQEFFMDSSYYANDSSFVDYFNGIYLKATNTTNSLLSLNLGSGLAGMTVYYQQDTLFKQYNFGFPGVTVANFEHDYTSSKIEQTINQSTGNDSICYLQGLQGLTIKGVFPDLAEDFSDVIVNKAEIIFTIADLVDNDVDEFALPQQLSMNYNSADTSRFFIDDYAFNVQLSNSSLLQLYFGGDVEKDETSGLNTYSMNISAHLQRYLNGEVPKTFYIRVADRYQQAHRAGLYGSASLSHPVKFNMTYTKPK